MEDENLTVRVPRWGTTALETICGMANAGGGCVLIPSSKKDYSSGFRKMRRSLESAPDAIASELGIRCTVGPVMDGSEFCVGIDVPPATEPLSLHGDYWLYTPEGNTLQTHETIFRTWQDEASTAWELRALPYVEKSDLAGDALLAIAGIPLASLEGAGGSLSDTVQARLDELSLTHPRTKKLVNAGGLLLCSNPARFIPGATVHIVPFNADGTQSGEGDEVVGPLAKQLDETVRLICDKYLPDISTAKAFTRKIPPRESIREAVANALLHKDYSSGVPVRITVSPQQLAIQNVGAVPEDWTVEDLVSSHSPRFRNPVLAATTRLLGITRGWGEGIGTMRNGCNQAGADLPHFELSSDRTTVAFPLPSTKRGASAVRAAEAAGSSRGGTAMAAAVGADGRAGGAPKQRTTFAERSIAAAHKLDMTQTDEYVLQVLTINGRATAPRIANVLGVSECTVRRSFKKLREYGFIERIGSDKAGYWSVNE